MMYYLIGALITLIIFGWVAIEEGSEPEEHWALAAIAVILCAIIWPVAWIAVLGLWIEDVRENKGEKS